MSLTIEHAEYVTLLLGDSQAPATQQMLANLVRQAAPAQRFSLAEANTPAIGELWPGQGGYYVGILPALDDRPAMHMIAAAQESQPLKWGPYDEEEVAGAASRHDGRANTKALMDAGGQKFPAAWWCADLEVGPLADFHLPSQAELFLASLYAPELFQKNGWYWSSTQGSRNIAFCQDFEYGYSYWLIKIDEFRARPFRWIPLNP